MRGRRIAVVASVLLIGTLASVGWFVIRPALALNKAEQTLYRNDPVAARIQLDRYRERWPNDRQALLLAAQAARRCDACAEAERLLTEYDEREGKSAARELEWLLLGVQQGDFAGQEETLRAQVDRNPADAPTILEALAKGYNVAFRYPDALAALNRLIEARPDHVPVLILRGKILDHQRQADAAEKDLRRAVELAPINVMAIIALADVLNHHGHTNGAIYYYEVARALRPSDLTFFVGLSRALTDAADLAAGASRLDELLAVSPAHADALVERGRLAIRRGQFAEAEQYLARAIRAAPWHRDGHRLQLIALKQLGRTEAATICEVRLAELRAEDELGGRLRVRARDAPRDTIVRWELWLWSQRNGQVEEGIAWLTEILRAEPKHAQAHAALADYFERAGQPRRAAVHRDAGSTSR